MRDWRFSIDSDALGHASLALPFWVCFEVMRTPEDEVLAWIYTSSEDSHNRPFQKLMHSENSRALQKNLIELRLAIVQETRPGEQQVGYRSFGMHRVRDFFLGGYRHSIRLIGRHQLTSLTIYLKDRFLDRRQGHMRIKLILEVLLRRD